jgi:hypothetical protein
MNDPAVPNLAWSVYNWRIWLGKSYIIRDLANRHAALIHEWMREL